MFQTEVIEKIETHILCSITFISPPKVVPFIRFVEKCSTGQATDDNVAHAHCMPDTKGYKHIQYVVLIAFALQQWLHEHAVMLRYTYIACLLFHCRHNFIHSMCL
jgi:hypothetical protein